MADLVTLHEGDVLVLRARQPDNDYARAVLAESAAEIGRLTGTTIVLLEPDQSLEKQAEDVDTITVTCRECGEPIKLHGLTPDGRLIRVQCFLGHWTEIERP